MIAAVLCTGPSLTQADVDYCRGKCKVVAVSNAIDLAPWADALVAYDRAWWRAYKPKFEGPKFHCHCEEIDGMEMVTERPGNSGALGLVVAQKLWNPSRILLLGADLKGSHFFGSHAQAGLRDPNANQFRTMIRHYEKLKHLPVVNCSPDSALTCFPKMSLKDALADVSQRTAA
jgi:hypothetical protein